MHRVIFFVFILFFLCGCAVLEYSEQIGALRDIEKSQKDMGSFVEEKQGLFDLLLSDIKAGRLKKDMPKESVLKIYGGPILSKQENGKEALLYRHPLDFFSDKIYLYFDRSERLIEWEYRAYNK